MGATIKVPATAAIHSPTNERPDLGAVHSTGPFPRRSQPGFLGGTAIVTGDSQGGVIYATDVFSDMSENVVVGEATASVVDGPADPGDGQQHPAGAAWTTRGCRLAGRSTASASRSTRPTITAGTLVAVEGYYAGGQLNYHTFEADGARRGEPHDRRGEHPARAVPHPRRRPRRARGARRLEEPGQRR